MIGNLVRKKYRIFLLGSLLTIIASGLVAQQVYGLTGTLPEGSVQYYRIQSMAAGTTYNISVVPTGSIDFKFTLFSDRFCKEIVLVSDNPTLGTVESSLFTPGSSQDYFLALESTFGWGNFDLTVRDQLTSQQLTIVSHTIPDLIWLWIVLGTVGGLLVLGLISFIVVRVVRNREKAPTPSKKRKKRVPDKTIQKALVKGQNALQEGYYKQALEQFRYVLSLQKDSVVAKEGQKQAKKALASLDDSSRQRLILNAGDRERFIKRFEESSGLNREQLESYAVQILTVLKDEERMPDSQKMFLKMQIPLELQDDVRAYLLSQPETDIERLSPDISNLVDSLSKSIFESYSSSRLELDFGDIVLEMNQSVIDSKITLAAIQSAVKKPYTKLDSLDQFSDIELVLLDQLTPKLFSLIQEKGVVSAFDVMNSLKIGCVTAHKILSLINYLQTTDEISVKERFQKQAVKKLMKHIVKHDNGEMPQNFSIEELISKGLTALEAEAFVNEYERILKKAARTKPSEKESIELQQEFFNLMEACKAEGVSASIASNIYLQDKSLEEAIKIDLHIRNTILPNLDSFTSDDVDLPTISLGAKEIKSQVFKEEEEKAVVKSDVPIGTRCMVSGLVIDFENDRIVACPYCGNIAKFEMLAEWLKVKSVCPVCKNKLKIEDCQEISLSDVYS